MPSYEDDQPDDGSDDLSERDLPREEDMDADPDGPATDDCPHCGKVIIEDSLWCPHCGSYLSREDAPRHVPLWLLAGLALAAVVVIAWMMSSAKGWY